MSEFAISRRTVLGGAVTAALLPALASQSLAASAASRGKPGLASSGGKSRFLHSATALRDSCHSRAPRLRRVPARPTSSGRRGSVVGVSGMEQQHAAEMLAIVAGLVAPVCEEIIFRGLLWGQRQGLRR